MFCAIFYIKHCFAIFICDYLCHCNTLVHFFSYLTIIVSCGKVLFVCFFCYPVINTSCPRAKAEEIEWPRAKFGDMARSDCPFSAQGNCCDDCYIFLVDKRWFKG